MSEISEYDYASKEFIADLLQRKGLAPVTRWILTIMTLFTVILTFTSSLSAQETTNEPTSDETPETECAGYPGVTDLFQEDGPYTRGDTNETVIYKWTQEETTSFLLVFENSSFNETTLNVVFAQSNRQITYEEMVPGTSEADPNWWFVKQFTVPNDFELASINWEFMPGRNGRISFQLFQVELPDEAKAIQVVRGTSGIQTYCSFFLALAEEEIGDVQIVGLNSFSGQGLYYQGSLEDFSLYSEVGYPILWIFQPYNDRDLELINEDDLIFNISTLEETPEATPRVTPNS